MSKLANTFNLYKALGMCIAIVASFHSAQSFAVLEGGTAITNTATVNYQDLASTTYSDSDSITVTVAIILGYEWRNYTAGDDEEAGATQSVGTITLDLANTGNAFDNTLDVYPRRDYDELDTANGAANGTMTVNECSGDGALTDNGTVGDDLTCTTPLTWDAVNDVDLFAYGIKSIVDSTNSGGDQVTITFYTDLTGAAGEPTAGDLIIFDDGTTIYEVFSVSTGGAAGADFIVVDDTPGDLNGATFGLVQELKRFSINGNLPTLANAAGNVDSHSNITWEFEAQDVNNVEYCTVTTCPNGGTDNSAGDNRTGTNLAIAVLGPDITIVKYVRAEDAANAANGTAAAACDSRDFNGATGAKTYHGDESGADACTLDNVDDNATLFYVIAVNNSAGLTGGSAAKTVSTGANCVTSPGAAATNVCVGTASAVIVTDPLSGLVTLDTTVHEIDEDCAAGAWTAEQSDTFAASNGKIWNNADTLTFYPDDTAGADTGSDTTNTGGTVDPAAEVCMRYKVSL